MIKGTFGRGSTHPVQDYPGPSRTKWDFQASIISLRMSPPRRGGDRISDLAPVLYSAAPPPQKKKQEDELKKHIKPYSSTLAVV